MSATFKLHMGDCIASMRAMTDASVDSIVTDPPYELGFMGKTWDASGIANSVEMWAEALRVLKPGGHLLAFSGSRTYHRMVCAIEDAGFDIRDQIMWVYGSGFPKSLNVANAIHDAAIGQPQGGAKPGSVNHGKFKGGTVEHATGRGFGAGPGQFMAETGVKGERELVDAARQWEGWGTALKPAHEPIVVARKPLIGTVAANVLAHGTGALNIDGCRVSTNDNLNGGAYSAERKPSESEWVKHGGTIHSSTGQQFVQPVGRWPANLIHDGSEEVLAAFPQAPGQMAKASMADTQRAGQNVYGVMARGSNGAEPRADAGSAARFFYAAKASKSDRNEGLDDFALITTNDGRAVAADNAYQRGKTERANHHPTVKPTDLMAYLVRLVTPPGGTVLDPFTGSGSTGKACMREGFNFIGCELSPEYLAIAQARIEHEQLLAAQRAYDAMLKAA